MEVPDTLTPQSALARALELRQRRRVASEAWSTALFQCWHDRTAENRELAATAEQEYEASVEDFRRFLVSVGASSLDELVYRAKEA